MKTLLLLLVCAFVSASLLRRLWRGEGDSAPRRLFWSAVVCVPLIGWVFYGCFYSPPGGNAIRAKGNASGWGYWGDA